MSQTKIKSNTVNVGYVQSARLKSNYISVRMRYYVFTGKKMHDCKIKV